MSEWVAVQVWVVRLALLALPLLVALSWRTAREWLREVTRGTWLALGAIVLLGAGARAVFSLWSVNHENGIGWIIFEDALALDHAPSYGIGGHALYQLVLTILPTDPTSLFAFDFVLGSLTPALLFLVGWGLLRSAPGALVAAALLAASPTHVRLSASESLHVPLLFLGNLGLAALLCGLARDPARDPAEESNRSPGRHAGWHERAPLLLAATALALAIQMRPLGALLVVPVALVLAFRARRPLAWLRSRSLWSAAALALALSAVHLVIVWRRVTAGDGGLGFFRVSPTDILPRLLVPAQHALVDPAVTPLALAVLTLLGVVALVVFDRRALAVLLPTWAVYTWLHTTHGENPVDQLRFHMGPLPWTALLGGAAMVALERLASTTARGRAVTAAFTAAVVLFAASGLYLQRGVLADRYDGHRELDFWRGALPALPAQGTLVHLDRFTAERVLTTALPLSWFRAEGHDLRTVEASALLAAPDAVFSGASDGVGSVVWYRGVTCWAFDRTLELESGHAAVSAGAPGGAGEGGDPLLRPLCRAVERRFRLTPLAETTFRANPDRFVTAARDLTIGFYRLEPR